MPHGSVIEMTGMRGFPQHDVAPGSLLWRIHGAEREPWFFRNDGLFRFDLLGNPDHGTCYFAEQPLGAFVETLQNFRTVPLPRSELDERRLFKLELANALSLADLTHNRAGSFEVDASLAAGPGHDYGPSQDFAAQAYRSGFAGIRYRVRHDLEQHLLGVALFGPLGSHAGDALMVPGISEEIPETVVEEACGIGFRVRGPLLEPAG
jgi:RES domain